MARVLGASDYYPEESLAVGIQAMGERPGSGVFGEVVADMRAKLIDEGWFGRRTPDRPGDALANLWGVTSGDQFARDWAVCEPGEVQADQDKGAELDR
ncbi:hypothetical protein ER13_04055 [Brevundimonas sp. EAKA]|nr:hypothetical protein ER13_04055 [Brevundimonas sp. EAKA]